MTDPHELLPPSSTGFERAVLDAGAVDLSLYDVLATMADPMAAPASVLPHLAWGWSTDYWRVDWPEHRKRQVVLEQPAFHRLKATISADRMACSYADAELISYHVPRDGFVIGGGPTPEAYARWIAGLPEIRIYPTGLLPNRFPPLGGALGRHPACRAGQMVRGRRAELRRGERAIPLVVSGETVGPDGIALAEIERVSIPKAAAATLSVGHGRINRPIAGKPLTRRVFDFDWRPTSADPFDLKPGVPSLIPVEAVPRKVAILRPHRSFRMVLGRSPLRGAVGAEPARENYYLALRVADGSGPSGARPRNGAVGRHRLPRAPFTKELSVLVVRPKRKGFPFSGNRVVIDPSSKVEDVLQAISTAQAARDRVVVNFNIFAPLTVADLDAIDETTRVGALKMMTRR